MKSTLFLTAFLGLSLFSLSPARAQDAGTASAAAVPPPRNIIYILADDFGYGSLGCYGATQVKTPNIDRLATEGMRFTDAYAPSSVCSPSRYAVMTGRFFWRTTNNCQVLENDAPFHTGLNRTTIASLLKSAGYTTACIGKWHLGIGNGPHTDWNAPLQPGPLEAGFDYFYGMPSNDPNPPPLFVENHSVAGQAPGTQITFTGFGNKTVASGITHPRVEVEVAPTFNSKAVQFIEDHKDVPFFLFYTPNEVHDEISPSPEFQGSTKIGPYGDFIQQLDSDVGKILDTLDKLGLAKDTLVVFSSDNGAVVVFGARMNTTPQGQAQKMGFNANGALRGSKQTVWEGGFRVPFLARWPAQIPAGVVSPAIINLADFLATASALTHKPIPPADGEDSFNILPVLLNKTQDTKGRDFTVSLSARGNYAVRSGDWKYIEKRIDANFPPVIDKVHIAAENAFQLYNLKDDLAETKNLYDENRAEADKLQADLNACRDNHASHPQWNEDLEFNPNN